MAMPAPSPPAAPGESPFEAELDGSALAGAALESGFELDCVEALLVLDDVSDDVPVFVAGVLVAATAVMGQYCSRFWGAGASKVSFVALSHAAFLFLSCPQHDHILSAGSKTTSVRGWSTHSFGQAATANFASVQPEA
jgi:hypothetical protein